MYLINTRKIVNQFANQEMQILYQIGPWYLISTKYTSAIRCPLVPRIKLLSQNSMNNIDYVEKIWHPNILKIYNFGIIKLTSKPHCDSCMLLGLGLDSWNDILQITLYIEGIIVLSCKETHCYSIIVPFSVDLTYI